MMTYIMHPYILDYLKMDPLVASVFYDEST